MHTDFDQAAATAELHDNHRVSRVEDREMVAVRRRSSADVFQAERVEVPRMCELLAETQVQIQRAKQLRDELELFRMTRELGKARMERGHAAGNAVSLHRWHDERPSAPEQHLESERDALALLRKISDAVNSKLDLEELFTTVAAALGQVVQFPYLGFALYDADKKQLVSHVRVFPESREVMQQKIALPLDSPSGMAFTSEKPVLLRSIDADTFPSDVARVLKTAGIKSTCSVPMISHGVLMQVTNQMAIAVENSLAHREIGDLKHKLTAATVFLDKEICINHEFPAIMGESPAIKRVLKQIEIVAQTDSTVLIQGETGTGKELIARAIHNLSARRARNLVKINCAAVPSGLLESELFGHEKGAFTGVIGQRVGRFESADAGTLFLDEIGGIPLELQPKLLRVLQEQEFERLGSNRTIRVNVRVVAATMWNLLDRMDQKQFRSDLYYRLNVFPIRVPRFVSGGKTSLFWCITSSRNTRSGFKSVDRVPVAVMNALSQHDWPGNVRQLENFIERSVILSAETELRAPLAELSSSSTLTAATSVLTRKEAERQHVLRVLSEAHWVIARRQGAAARLGMNRSTLNSLIKRLEIVRPSEPIIAGAPPAATSAPVKSQ